MELASRPRQAARRTERSDREGGVGSARLSLGHDPHPALRATLSRKRERELENLLPACGEKVAEGRMRGRRGLAAILAAGSPAACRPAGSRRYLTAGTFWSRTISPASGRGNSRTEGRMR